MVVHIDDRGLGGAQGGAGHGGRPQHDELPTVRMHRADAMGASPRSGPGLRPDLLHGAPARALSKPDARMSAEVSNQR